MKNKKYHTVGAVPKSNIKILVGGQIDNSSKYIHDHSLSWLGTVTQYLKCRNVTPLVAFLSLVTLTFPAVLFFIIILLLL